MNGDAGMIAENLNADTQLLNMLNTFVSSQSCVLLLGPLFGIDRNNQKIHSTLRNFLTFPPKSLSLDEEFDNLYISTLTDGSQNSNLIYEIDNFYVNVAPSDVYEKILSIGFRAIISYTSDLLLEKANTRNEYDFYYFSAKGTQVTESTQISNVSKKPVIYNIFGSINDLNSLILDYDSLYDFLINILKADQEVPLQLKSILGSARAFLFLGFDLRKWYIPLIIRKFNQFILNGSRTRAAVSAFACLDDTPNIPNSSFTESLNKYPLLFKPFSRMTSVQLINELSNLPRKKPAPGSIGPEPLNEREVLFFQKWNHDLKGLSIEQGLDDFFKAFRDLSYSGLFNKEIILLGMQFNDLMLKKHAGMITSEDLAVSGNNIVDSLFRWMEKILTS